MLDFKGDINAGKKFAKKIFDSIDDKGPSAQWKMGMTENLKKLEKYASSLKPETADNDGFDRMQPAELNASLGGRIKSFRDMIKSMVILNDDSITNPETQQKALETFQNSYNKLNENKLITSSFNIRHKKEVSFAEEAVQFITDNHFDLDADLEAQTLSQMLFTCSGIEGLTQQLQTMGMLKNAKKEADEFEKVNNQFVRDSKKTGKEIEDLVGCKFDESYSFGSLKKDRDELHKVFDEKKSSLTPDELAEITTDLADVDKAVELGEDLSRKHSEVNAVGEKALKTRDDALNSPKFNNLVNGLQGVLNNIQQVKRLGGHKNTKEYTKMVSSLFESIGDLQNPAKSREEKIKKLRDCKNSADEYLSAKRKQVFVVGSDMRKSRIACASLISSLIKDELNRQERISRSQVYKDVKNSLKSLRGDEAEKNAEPEKTKAVQNNMPTQKEKPAMQV